MAAVSTIAAVSAGLVAAASGGAQAYQARRQEKEADRASERQAFEQKKYEDKIKKRREEEEGEAARTKTRNDAAMRQRMMALGASGRSSTIATGPLGLTTAAPTIYKTILGA